MAPIKPYFQQKREPCVSILLYAAKSESSSKNILDIIIQYNGNDALSETKGLLIEYTDKTNGTDSPYLNSLDLQEEAKVEILPIVFQNYEKF